MVGPISHPLRRTLASAALLCAFVGALASPSSEPGESDAARLTAILSSLESYRDLPAEQVSELGLEGLAILASHPDPRHETTVRAALSWALSKRGDADRGLDEALESRRLAESLGDDEAAGRAHYLEGVARWYRGETDEALDAGARALELQRGQDRPLETATTLTLLGAIHRSRGSTVEALEAHMQALELSEAGDDLRGIARSQVNIGLIYWNLDEMETACDKMREALAVYRRLDHPDGLATTLNNLGLLYNEMDESEQALVYLEEAHALYLELGNHRGLSLVLSNIGFAHEKLGDKDAALDYGFRTLELREQLKDHRGIARSLGNIATIYLGQERFAEALDYFQRALPHAEQSEALREQSAILDGIGECQEQLGNETAALEAYRRHREIAAGLDSEDQLERIANLETRYELATKARELEALERERAEQALALSRQKLYGTLLASGIVLLAVATGVLWWTARSRSRSLAAVRKSHEQLSETAAELRKMEQHYRSVFEEAKEAKLFVDLTQGTILDANGPAGRLCGEEPAALRGTRLDALEPAWLASPLSALDPELSEVTSRHLSWTESDGPARHAEVWVSPLAVGEHRYAFVTVYDTTSRHKTEEERIRNDKLESLGLLAGGIAHDFNNTLTAILGYVSIARVQVPGDSPVDPLLDGAESAISQASNLTSQLLAFSKGGAPRRELVDVYELLRDSVRFAISGSASRVEFEIASDLWPAQLDPGQFKQVVSNLVINADQAMSAGGTILVRARNRQVDAPLSPAAGAGPYVVIEIVDSGPGIPPEIRDKILDPYFTTKGNGSGLGLSTAFAILSRHQGLLDFDSRPGEGATFRAYFPATPDGKIAMETPTAGKRRAGGRVLVMDDDPLIQNVYRVGLAAQGYEVEIVGDGKAAVEAYDRARAAGRGFDLVIMDLTIPGGMGGKDAMRELRRRDPDVLGIVASGYSQDPVMSNYRRHGFAASVAKPFAIHQLGELVGRLIGPARPRRRRGRLRGTETHPPS